MSALPHIKMKRPILAFASFDLDLDAERLTRAGQVVMLRPKTFAVLRYLVENAGRMVSKSDLLGSVWSEVTVTDDVARISIRELRRALGDDPAVPRFIETVHGRGYRFVAEIEERPPVGTSTAMDSQPTADEPSLVGRDQALARLRADLAQAVKGDRQIVFLSGEPGIGKTALANAFADSASRLGPGDRQGFGTDVLVGRGHSVEQFGSSDPYLPFVEALAQICQSEHADRVRAILARAPVPWLSRSLSLLAETEGNGAAPEEGSISPERILRLMAETLENLAADIPLVLILEDLHWSDPSTVDLINVLSRRSNSAPLMIVGTFRPAEIISHEHPLSTVIGELRRKRLCRRIDLPALDEEAVEQFLRQRCGDVEVTERLVRLVFEQSGGNPFFMSALVDHLRGLGVLEEVSAGSEVDIGIPESLREMIEAKLDELDPDDIELLGAASVVGTEFELQPVAAALAEIDIERVEDACETLVRRQRFLRPAGEGEWPDGSCGARYRFEHDLYRQVVYARLPPNRRRRLHRQVGERLRQGYPDNPAEVASQLAEHYERGGDPENAIAFHLEAARGAHERVSMPVEVSHLESALRLTEHLPESIETAIRQVEILIQLGEAKLAILVPEVDTVFTRLADVAERWQLPVASAIAAAGIFAGYSMRAKLGPAREWAERLIAMKDEVPLPVEPLGRVQLGCVLFNLGQFDEARGTLESSTATLTENDFGENFVSESAASPAFLYILQYSHLSYVYALQGHIEKARAAADGILEAAAKFNSPRYIAHAKTLAAQLHAMLGDRDAVEPLATSILEIGEEYGLPGFRAEGRYFLAWAHGGTEAAAVMAEALEERLRSGFIISASFFYALLADTCLREGDVTQARAWLARAFDYVEETAEHRQLSDLHRLRGECALEEGDPNGAAESFHRSLEIAEAQGARLCELRALAALARLPGQPARLRRALGDCCAWFGEAVESVDLAQARLLV